MATDLGVKVTEEGKYFFISYNTEDAELVSSYLKRMADYGLPVWYDDGIPQGEEWEEIIAEKIYNCEDVIMFISNNVFKKEDSYVKKEWKIAKGRTKPKKVYIIVLDQIDEDNIPPRYAFWWNDIKDIQSIQAYTMEIDACVDKILDSVGFKKQTNPLNQTTNQTEGDFSQYPDFVIEEGVLKSYKGNDSVVTIPYGVTSIGWGAFCDCNSLENIVIPNSVISISNNAFWGCRSLTSVKIPYGVKTIGDYAFYRCYSLTSIDIPNSITSIGYRAFEYCSLLTSIVIPDSVISIGDSAFLWCSSLKSVIIGDGVKSIGKGAFCDCSSLISVNIPDSITSIGDCAFLDCYSIKSINIPDSVTSIGYRVFENCNSLTNISVSIGNPSYKSINGNLYSKDGKTFVQYAIGKTDTMFTIPDGVTSICGSAFYNCKLLTSIVVPSSITSIANRTFYACNSIRNIYYTGNEQDWNKISIGLLNNCLTEATIHYNYIP